MTSTPTAIHNPTVRRALIALAAIMASLLTVLAAGAPPARAQDVLPSGTTITVNTADDEDNTDGDCSLREAIKAANTNLPVDACPAGSSTGEDAIGFNTGSATATITLGSTLPNVTDGAGLVIDGGSAGASVSGNDQVRVLYNQAKLTLRDLTITRGRAYTTHPSGFSDPAAAGGAIYNAGGTLELAGVTLSANKAMINGGAIANRGGGSLKVTGSTFSGNIADMAGGRDYSGGGGAIQGSSQVTDTTFANNQGYYGGAIYGYVNVSSSTFTQNAAYRGGGIFGSPKVSNSTFANNSSGVGGGAIDTVHTGTAEVSSSTFYYNNNGGPHGLHGYAKLRNTILVEYQGQYACGIYGSDATGITDLGGNIEANNDTCGFTEANGSLPNTDPRLASAGLQNNGGPTKTIALQPTSPAIDLIPQGTNGCGTDLAEDQRGETRPRGPACDAGAFEAPPDVTVPAAPSIASPAEGSTNPACFTVSGTAEVNTTVELFEGAESRGTDGTGLSGEWSVALTGVPNGPHSYTAKATDVAGDTSPVSGTRALTVEWATPQAPAITAPPQGAFDEDGSFSVVGTAEPGAEVELFEDGTPKGTTTAGPGGGWSFPLSGVAEGSHSYKAKVTEPACGASAESEARTVTVDMTSPSVRKVVPAENATGIAARANVSALFSEEMQPTSVRGAFKLYKKGSTRALSAKVTYDAAAKKAVLNPTTNLTGGATYRAVVGTGAKDLASHALDQDPDASGNQEKAWIFKVKR